MNLLSMTKNQIFNLLYNLSGYSFNEKGFEASTGKIRNWRRANTDNQNYRPVPDFVLEVIFEEFFKAKRANDGVLTLPFIEPVKKTKK